MNKKDRLSDAFNYLRFRGIVQTYTDVAIQMGATLPNVSAAMNGKEKNLTDKFLKRFAKAYPEINISWLLTGEGQMLTAQSESNASVIGDVYATGNSDSEVSQVDYVPVSAHATFVENLYLPTNEASKYPVVLTSAEKKDISLYKVFEVDGDSMYPSIVNGALILAKEIPEKNWHYAEGVVVVIFAEFVVVKRIEKNDLLTNNLIILSSDNEKYGKLTVQLSDIRAIYKAKRILSSEIK